jgi:DNA-binding response OmpR family regulator
MNILIVEDEPYGSKMLDFILKEEGYNVTSVDNPRGALALIEKSLPDLILLDVGLPQMNGFDFYRKLRGNDYDIPVIFVTASAELEDKLQGLRLGADDYIVKPFALTELVARVQTVLRRYHKGTSQAGGQTLKVGGFEIKAAELEVTLPDRRTVLLTPREMRILFALASRAGQVLRREDLIDMIWGEDYPGDDNIVDVYIRRLRLKIERDPANPQYLQLARGLGYRFVGK